MLGAQVAMAKMAVADMGWAAALIDPQGNLCGLWEVNPASMARGGLS